MRTKMKTIPYTEMPLNEYEEYDLDTFTDEQLEDYYYDNPDDNDEKMAIYNNYGYELWART
jgi:hypothetical protein